MQPPLSAFLIIKSLVLPRSSKMFISFFERLGFRVFSSGSSASVFSMYSSSFGLQALGGIHRNFILKGCFLPCHLLLLKWCVILNCLARASKSLGSSDLLGGAGTGA